MGPRDPMQEVQDRKGDRHQDALEHPERQHASRGRHRQRELGATEPRDPHELGHIHETDLGHRCRPFDGQSGKSVELAEHHEHGDTGHIADEDGAGQQIGKETQTSHTCHEADQGDQAGEAGGERGIPARLSLRDTGQSGAVIRAVVESGPTDSWGDDPKSTYTASDVTAAQRPTTAGSPATSAYAITWGMRYAATVTPARTSPLSQRRG